MKGQININSQENVLDMNIEDLYEKPVRGLTQRRRDQNLTDYRESMYGMHLIIIDDYHYKSLNITLR